MSEKPMFEGIDLSGLDELRVKDTSPVQGSQGPTRLPLASVIEDPDQPRTTFDDEALRELAASIAKRGVLQPIIVRPVNDDGKHIIVMGARRFRASQLAKKDDIPVFIRAEASDGYDQMIENIQREALAHKDIAAFIREEIAKGTKQSAIATSLGKPRSWMTAYIGFFDMDPAIQEGVESYGARTAYELNEAMKLDPVRTRAFMAQADGITQRGARQLAQSLRGKGVATGAPSNAEAGDTNPDPQNGKGESRPEGASKPTPRNAQPEPQETRSPQNAASPVSPQTAIPPRFAVMVQAGERIGRLAIDQPAEQGSNFGTVILDNGKSVIEVAVKDLEIIEIVRLD